MGLKTKVHAEDGRQDLLITRDFEIPVDLLFKAHTDPEIVAEWMGTEVIKLESRKHGSWHFRTRDPQGNVAFNATGVFHEFIDDKRIIRTFEMDNAIFDVQLEFLEFEAITDDTSRLKMQVIYKSVGHRDQMLKLPFAQGMNMAHNKLEEVVRKLK